MDCERYIMDFTSLPVANSIDPINDVIAIVTKSLNQTGQINRNTFLDLSSAPVGISDTQTLTNKTLTSPTISGPTLSGTLSGTYTIGGTPTFPSTVVSTTSTQTLTNKTLTSPTINSPTITNATLTSDSIAGYTSTDIGSIYGISITNSAITNSSAIGAGIIFPDALISGLSSSTWAWVNYSSSITFANFTIGNGTVIARYTQIGKTIHYRGEVTLGSTSSMGSGPTITLPVTSSSTGYSNTSSDGYDIIGTGGLLHVGTGVFLVQYTWDTSTTAAIWVQNAAFAYVSNASITASVPITLGSGDVFTWNITYEAA